MEGIVPTTLPARAIQRVDDFPFRTVVFVAFLGIALGLWGNVADESVSPGAPASFTNAGGNDSRPTEPAFDTALLSGLRFAP
jgi:hypothetical protein